jgi:hypothetical protein
LYICAPLQQQGAEYRPVTAAFVRAIATDGEVGLLRENGKEVKGPALLRISHIGAVTA